MFLIEPKSQVLQSMFYICLQYNSKCSLVVLTLVEVKNMKILYILMVQKKSSQGMISVNIINQKVPTCGCEPVNFESNFVVLLT